MKKVIQYIVIVVVIVLVGYNSVYFRKLSSVKNTANAKFDPASFSKQLWNEKMPARIDSAVDLGSFIAEVTADKEAALKKHSHALGIGNYRYALIKTQGTVTAVQEDEIQLQLPVGDSVINAVLATEYIYGNGIRDASGLVDINDFPNTADLNSISEEMNKIVRSMVVPSFRSSVKTGDKVNITAAVELNKEHIKWTGLELLPVRLQIVH